MQAVLDNNQHLSPSVQTRLKTIFNGIFRLALENDLINVDYSRYLERTLLPNKHPAVFLLTVKSNVYGKILN